MKFDQDLSFYLWYELNPRVRCAFGNVLCIITRYQGPRVMQKYEIREEMIKVFCKNKYKKPCWSRSSLARFPNPLLEASESGNLARSIPAQVVRIGSDKTEAVEVLFIIITATIANIMIIISITVIVRVVTINRLSSSWRASWSRSPPTSSSRPRSSTSSASAPTTTRTTTSSPPSESTSRPCSCLLPWLCRS